MEARWVGGKRWPPLSFLRRDMVMAAGLSAYKRTGRGRLSALASGQADDGSNCHLGNSTWKGLKNFLPKFLRLL